MTTTFRRTRTYSPNGEVGKRLAEVKRLSDTIKELEAQLLPHRVWLRDHMQRNRLPSIAIGDLRVVLKVRHNWTYSPQTQREMLALRNTQHWEQSELVATDNPTHYVSIS